MKRLFRLFVAVLGISFLMQFPSPLYAVGASGLSTQLVRRGVRRIFVDE
jgi:hypothetical protein